MVKGDLSGQFLNAAMFPTSFLVLNYDVAGKTNGIITGSAGEVVSVPVGQRYLVNGNVYEVISWSQRDSPTPVTQVTLGGSISMLYANANVMYSVTFTDGTKTVVKEYSSGQSVTTDFLDETFPIPSGYDARGCQTGGVDITIPYSVTGAVTIVVSYLMMTITDLFIRITESATGEIGTITPTVECHTSYLQIPGIVNQRVVNMQFHANSDDSANNLQVSSFVDVLDDTPFYSFLVLRVNGVVTPITAYEVSAGVSIIGFRGSYSTTPNCSTVCISGGGFFSHSLVNGKIRLMESSSPGRQLAGLASDVDPSTLTDRKSVV